MTRKMRVELDGHDVRATVYRVTDMQWACHIQCSCGTPFPQSQPGSYSMSYMNPLPDTASLMNIAKQHVRTVKQESEAIAAANRLGFV